MERTSYVGARPLHPRRSIILLRLTVLIAILATSGLYEKAYAQLRDPKRQEQTEKKDKYFPFGRPREEASIPLKSAGQSKSTPTKEEPAKKEASKETPKTSEPKQEVAKQEQATPVIEPAREATKAETKQEAKKLEETAPAVEPAREATKAETKQEAKKLEETAPAVEPAREATKAETKQEAKKLEETAPAVEPAREATKAETKQEAKKLEETAPAVEPAREAAKTEAKQETKKLEETAPAREAQAKEAQAKEAASDMATAVAKTTQGATPQAEEAISPRPTKHADSRSVETPPAPELPSSPEAMPIPSPATASEARIASRYDDLPVGKRLLSTLVSKISFARPNEKSRLFMYDPKAELNVVRPEGASANLQHYHGRSSSIEVEYKIAELADTLLFHVDGDVYHANIFAGGHAQGLKRSFQSIEGAEIMVLTAMEDILLIAQTPTDRGEKLTIHKGSYFIFTTDAPEKK